MKIRLTTMLGDTRDIEIDAHNKSDVLKFIELYKNTLTKNQIMFTGIVAAVGRITAIEPIGDDHKGGMRLQINSGGLPMGDVAIGGVSTPMVTSPSPASPTAPL